MITPYQRELLVILVEECAEIQKAATKLMRFGATARDGFTRKTYNNAHDLGSEIGELKEVISRLLDDDLISQSAIDLGIERKRSLLKLYLRNKPRG